MKGLLFCLAALPDIAVAQKSPAKLERFFDNRVAPILSKRCLGCHNQDLKDGGISFLDRESLLKGGPRGPAVVPGNPAGSFLIQAVRHDGEIQMPPGAKLSQREIAILTEWIRQGAHWGKKLGRKSAKK